MPETPRQQHPNPSSSLGLVGFLKLIIWVGRLEPFHVWLDIKTLAQLRGSPFPNLFGPRC